MQIVSMKTETKIKKMEEDKMFNAYKVLKVVSDKETEPCLAFDEPLIDIEGLALFTPKGSYYRIFKKDKGKASQRKQRLSTIKITCDKRKIFRQYASRSIDNLNGGCIGLSPNSWQQLLLKEASEKKVHVEKCCSFWFFWNHPNSATRISYKLGMIGALLAIIGISLSVVFQCI